MPRPITVTVTSEGLSGDARHFSCTESFESAADAEHWEQMVKETLARPEAFWLDLQAYASGLADTVRTHGGAVTRENWLSGEVSPNEWALGRPVRGQNTAAERPELRRRQRKRE